MALERAVRKAENAQQTKSFRLGYALIFGFKSWQGFKDMFRTLYSLYKERNTQKTKPGLPSDNTLLAQPLKKKISWDSQKTCSAMDTTKRFALFIRFYPSSFIFGCTRVFCFAQRRHRKRDGLHNLSTALG
ncbi:hypothetical protein [Pasteurella multocida]|uniref:hypothetical protein n=1 Tax=Pasteurella multocida TaxID=747 RepID=UPI001008FE9B|nr:hypothetical protein [Pasteurella multocida]